MNTESILNWLKTIAVEGDLPIECKAIYIGLMDGSDNYMMHFLGSASYSDTDDDWACTESVDYIPKNQYYDSEIDIEDEEWDQFLEKAVKSINDILHNHKTILNQIKHIGLGFDSGNLIRL